MRARTACVLLVALLVGACAAPLEPGRSREADVYASLGTPDESVERPDRRRTLTYPGGRFGLQSWRVTISPDGIVESVEPLLTEERFALIRPPMTQAEVRQALGRPAETMRFPNLGEEVWSWRYLEFGDRHVFFNVHFDERSGTVRRTSRTDDPLPRHPFLLF